MVVSVVLLVCGWAEAGDEVILMVLYVGRGSGGGGGGSVLLFSLLLL